MLRRKKEASVDLSQGIQDSHAARRGHIDLDHDTDSFVSESERVYPFSIEPISMVDFNRTMFPAMPPEIGMTTKSRG